MYEAARLVADEVVQFRSFLTFHSSMFTVGNRPTENSLINADIGKIIIFQANPTVLPTPPLSAMGEVKNANESIKCFMLRRSAQSTLWRASNEVK